MKRAWEYCPEIYILAPLPSSQRYDLRQVSSHLGTQESLKRYWGSWAIWSLKALPAGHTVLCCRVHWHGSLHPQTDIGPSKSHGRKWRWAQIWLVKQTLLLPLLSEHLRLTVTFTTRAKGRFCHQQFNFWFHYLNWWLKHPISSRNSQKVDKAHHSLSQSL